ncbi:MAG: hypothetical protein GYA21_01400 [Myxococcales bacterium]|nr:hypothetical protein [Myxococcales bacterium]
MVQKEFCSCFAAAGILVVLSIILPVLPVAAQTDSSPAHSAEPPDAISEAAEESPARCRIHLRFGSLLNEDVLVEEKRIQGSNLSIREEDGIFYGFAYGQSTRFRIEDGRVSGSISELGLMLNVRIEGPFSEVSGLIEATRVSARVSENAILVKGPGAGLSLKLQRGNHLSGSFVAGSQIGTADFTSFGCNLETIRKRPELIVILLLLWMAR